MTPVEALIKTKEVLQERGRCRGHLEDDEGQVCLVGAFNLATYGSVSHPGITTATEVSELRLTTWNLLGRAIRTGEDDPVRYNDTIYVTDDDIFQLIDRAVVLAEQEQQ